MSKGHKQGGKITGSHTTVIPAAEKLIDFLQKQKIVNKISIGFIKHGIRNGRHSIKIMQMNSGLLLKIRGSASIQEIRVYTNKEDELKVNIEQFAKMNKYLCSGFKL
jgi:hypothetical protein